MEKTITKFGDIKIYKQDFHQHKNLFFKKSIDIDKIVVSNKVSFGKKEFKSFIGCKDHKKLNLYLYPSQKWVYMEKTLVRLNTCFFDKRSWIIREI